MTGGVEARLAALLETVLGARPVSVRPLGGGCVADVRRVDLSDGRAVVVKSTGAAPPATEQAATATSATAATAAIAATDGTGGTDTAGASAANQPPGQFDLEAFMLQYLRRHGPLPVPGVLHAAPDLLVLEFLPGAAVATPAAEEDLGRRLAGLHAVSAVQFGFERDTLIGPLPQANPWTAQWLDFFREERLLAMAREAARAGALPAPLLARIERLAERLEKWLPPSAAPALLHGDLWGGNVLADAARVTAVLDPALYFGDPEIELAFSMLFHSFGRRMYEAYAELRPIAREFFSERKDLYNLYPLLVHVRLFGGGYVAQVEATLRRFER